MTHPLAPAKLDDDALKEIRALESETRTVLVALEPQPTLATLSEHDLQTIRAAEQRLGVVMVAYDT